MQEMQEYIQGMNSYSLNHDHCKSGPTQTPYEEGAQSYTVPNDHSGTITKFPMKMRSL